MDKTLKISLIVIGIILLLIVLYPKYAGYGYSGSLQLVEDSNVTIKQYSCFGFKYSTSCGGPFEFYRCVDGGSTIFCAGIPYSPKCYQPTVTKKLYSGTKIDWYTVECPKK